MVLGGFRSFLVLVLTTTHVAVKVVLYTESRHAMQIIQWKVIF